LQRFYAFFLLHRFPFSRCFFVHSFTKRFYDRSKIFSFPHNAARRVDCALFFSRRPQSFSPSRRKIPNTNLFSSRSKVRNLLCFSPSSCPPAPANAHYSVLIPTASNLVALSRVKLFIDKLDGGFRPYKSFFFSSGSFQSVSQTLKTCLPSLGFLSGGLAPSSNFLLPPLFPFHGRPPPISSVSTRRPILVVEPYLFG